MGYRKHGNSKGARRSHHKRERARRRKLREKGGQVEPFGYADIRGRDRASLRRMSVSKGARDGAPRYAIATEAGTAETTQIGSVEDEGAGPQDIAQESIPSSDMGKGE